ncbi:hypothetical protein CsSME_00037079 [Camellia sinensis var. sinensis]
MKKEASSILLTSEGREDVDEFIGVSLSFAWLVAGHWSWRFAFFGEAIVMVPFAILGFVIKPLQLKGFSPARSKKALTGTEIAVIDLKDDLTGKDGRLSVKEEFIDQGSEGPSK